VPRANHPRLEAKCPCGPGERRCLAEQPDVRRVDLAEVVCRPRVSMCKGHLTCNPGRDQQMLGDAWSSGAWGSEYPRNRMLGQLEAARETRVYVFRPGAGVAALVEASAAL
jgi:hypothetical protein